MFHKLNNLPQNVGIPQLFTCPFCYTPHPLVLYAAEEVKAYLLRQKAWEEELSYGKMFGVLIVVNSQNELGFVAAFSGNIDKRSCHDYFVPPIFDITQPNGIFKQQEQQITDINNQISKIEQSVEYVQLRAQYANFIHWAEQQLFDAKQQIKKHKAEREQIRACGTTAERMAELVKESQFEKAELKRLQQHLNQQQESILEKIKSFDNNLEKLRNERKKLSEALQNWLFNQYVVLNGKGEKATINDIFEQSRKTKPPAATGECAAPKMLQYAFANGLQPIAMGEFWWGKSPIGEVRQHGAFYPACHNKCEPLLNFMLQGIETETNRLISSLISDIEIIYDDEWLIAVNKPAGLLSVPGREAFESVCSVLSRMKLNKEDYFAVHRLDMATSGVLLLAKNKAVLALMQQQFEKRETQKQYIALLDGVPQTARGLIELPLRPNIDDRPRQMVDFEKGKKAITRYEVVEHTGAITRILFYPATGRTHQLRLHAAHQLGLNCPIVGDNLYGKPDKRLYLHAAKLTFTHPISGVAIAIEAKCDF